MNFRYLCFANCLLLCCFAVGCEKDKAGTAMPAPEVTVANPAVMEVQEYEYFTGNTDAKEKPEVRARVSGQIIQAPFTPGSEVEKDKQLLYEIDPSEYQNALERAEAEAKRFEALVKTLKEDFDRVKTLLPTKAISQQEYDKVAGDYAQAEAGLAGSRAKVKTEKLNVKWTKVFSPIDGRVGDKLVHVGDQVTGGQMGSVLTTVVSVDPMFVVFYVDDNTLLRLEQAVREGKIQMRDGDQIPVEVGLDIHKSAFPLKGAIRFKNNEVNAKTGTILVKAEVPNPKPPMGERLITSGMYARLRAPIGGPQKEMVVPESALLSDQGKKFLFAVDDQNKAIRLNAQVGLLQDGMRVIKSVQGPDDKKPRALKKDEKIIVKGLQRVRPGEPVAPKSANES